MLKHVPLLLSVVPHGFPHRSASREGAEAMAMLDTLISGVCQGSSGALREKAGQLVGEWLKWSSKHVTSKSAGKSAGRGVALGDN